MGGLHQGARPRSCSSLSFTLSHHLALRLQEYDGGTLMECILTARWPADFPAVIRAQREAVESKVKELTSSHIVYPGLAAFMPGGPNEKLRNGKIRTPVSFDEIDGLKAAGWCVASRRLPMRALRVLTACAAQGSGAHAAAAGAPRMRQRHADARKPARLHARCAYRGGGPRRLLALRGARGRRAGTRSSAHAG